MKRHLVVDTEKRDSRCAFENQGGASAGDRIAGDVERADATAWKVLKRPAAIHLVASQRECIDLRHYEPLPQGRAGKKRRLELEVS